MARVIDELTSTLATVVSVEVSPGAAMAGREPAPSNVPAAANATDLKASDHRLVADLGRLLGDGKFDAFSTVIMGGAFSL